MFLGIGNRGLEWGLGMGLGIRNTAVVSLSRATTIYRGAADFNFFAVALRSVAIGRTKGIERTRKKPIPPHSSITIG